TLGYNIAAAVVAIALDDQAPGPELGDAARTGSGIGHLVGQREQHGRRGRNREDLFDADPGRPQQLNDAARDIAAAQVHERALLVVIVTVEPDSVAPAAAMPSGRRARRCSAAPLSTWTNGCSVSPIPIMGRLPRDFGWLMLTQPFWISVVPV